MINYFSKDLEFDYMNIISSEESIAFQPKSNLAKKLINMFNKGFEIRKQKYNPVSNNINVVLMDIKKIIEKELPKIFKDELGLVIKEFYFNFNKPTGFVAINFYTSDIEATFEIQETSRGMNDNIPEDIITRIQEIIKIAKKLNSETGKLEYKKGWPIILYLDLALFYFSDLFIPKIRSLDFVENKGLTAEEISAIVMHEAGHAIMFLEKAVNAYYVQSSISDNIQKFLDSHPSLSNIKSFIEKILLPQTEYIKNDSKNYLFFKNILESTISIIDFIDSKINKFKFISEYKNTEIYKKLKENENELEENLNSNSYIEYINILLLKIITVTISGIIAYLSIPKNLNPIYWVINIHYPLTTFMNVISFLNKFDESEFMSTKASSKTSDIMLTRHNTYMIERLADEFVVRHGLGAELANGLAIIRTLFESLHITQNKLVLNSRLLYMLDMLFKFNMSIINRGLPHYTYEYDDQRTRRILQDIMAVFKDQSIPADFRDKQLIAARKLLKMLDSYDTDIYNRGIFPKIKELLTTLTSLNDITRIIVTGKLSQDYEKHLNQVEDLMNNSLYYHSAELKSLSEKMK